MNTITVHGSNGEIMAPFAEPGTFILGKRICVIITGIGTDPNTPQVVKEDLVGLPIDAIFTREQVIEQCGENFEASLPEGCLLAYAEEVIATLESANRYSASDALRKAAPDALDMYILEPGTFRVIPD